MVDAVLPAHLLLGCIVPLLQCGDTPLHHAPLLHLLLRIWHAALLAAVLLRHSLHPAGGAQLRQCSLQHGWEDALNEEKEEEEAGQQQDWQVANREAEGTVRNSRYGGSQSLLLQLLWWCWWGSVCYDTTNLLCALFCMLAHLARETKLPFITSPASAETARSK
jgi:hypothetical protein